MSNLATIQKIKDVRVHDNSDNLELADVLGWQVVVKKGEFKPGDLVVYVSIDTILPEIPEFEFLRNKDFRIKPIRLRGKASNGICFPLSILGEFAYDVDSMGTHTFTRNGKSIDYQDLKEGYDVTEFLGVKKYEKPVPANLAGQAFGHLPGFLIMTDEDNLRSYPDALYELIGKPYYITRKDDGSSGTFFIKNDEFGVCSRRIHLKEDKNNGFWQMAIKYDINARLHEFNVMGDIALQGEVVGPGIQGNPLGLKELEFHAFSLFDTLKREYYPYSILKDFCEYSKIPMVTVLDVNADFKHTLDDLIGLANKGIYPNGKPAEGIVIRPLIPFHSEVLNKPWSGKIINENYKETE